MFSSKNKSDIRYGLVVDVGSGSVGAALVSSDPSQKNPQIIWSHRERMAIKRETDLPNTAKNITAALVNCLLSVSSEGMKALKEHNKKASLKTIQIAISAPWSYTVNKTVSYSKEEPYEITKKLVRELTQVAEQQALEVIDENKVIEKLGLTTITKATVDISANGYHVQEAYGQCANHISISHISAIAQKHLLDAITETTDKVFPNVNLERYSFMLVYYCVLQRLAPDTTEICLVDVTFEATEIGIIRDGILRYSTHCPFGAYTLAREIAQACDIPEAEALGYLRGNKALESNLGPEKLANLRSVVESYEKSVAALFRRTGDQLSIPRPVFIHTDARSENFFADSIKKAAAQATKTEHGIHLVTSKFLEEDTHNDSAILLSAHFFHKMHGCDDFEQV